MAQQSLEKLLRFPESIRDKEAKGSGVTIRSASFAFARISRKLARENDASFSRMMRSATKLGVSRVYYDTIVVALRKVTDDLDDRAMNSGEQAALERLEEKLSYEFRHPAPCHTTLSMYPWVRGLLAEVSHICGVNVGQMAVIAVLYALETLSDERGYRRYVLDELEKFRDTMERRLRYLESK